MSLISPYAPGFIPHSELESTPRLALNPTEKGRLESILKSPFCILTDAGGSIQVSVQSFLRSFSGQIGALSQGIFGSSVAKVVAEKSAHDVDIYFVVPPHQGALAFAESAFRSVASRWGATPNKRFCLDDEALFLGVEGLDLVIFVEDCRARTYTSDDEQLRIYVAADGSGYFWGQGLSIKAIEDCKDQISHDASLIRNPEAVYSLFFRLVHKEQKGKILIDASALYQQACKQIDSTQPAVLARQFENLLKHYNPSIQKEVIWRVLELGRSCLAKLAVAAPEAEDIWLKLLKQYPEQAQLLWQLRKTGDVSVALSLAECGVDVASLGFDCTEAAKDAYRQKGALEKSAYLRRVDAPWFKDSAWLERQRHVCVLLEKGEELKKLRMSAWIEKAQNLPEDSVCRSAWKWFLQQNIPEPKTEGEHLALARAIVIAQLPIPLRPDLQGLDSEQLTALMAAEAEGDAIRQLEAYHVLRGAPALHPWLESQGALDVVSLAKERFQHDPTLLRRLSFWTDEAYIEKCLYEEACSHYQSCRIYDVLIKLRLHIVSISRLLELSEADWRVCKEDAALMSYVRPFLHQQLASYRAISAKLLQDLCATIHMLAKLGVLESSKSALAALADQVPPCFAELPSRHTAYLAAVFYQPDLARLAWPHLIFGLKEAVLSGGTGAKFASLLGIEATLPNLLPLFTSADPSFLQVLKSRQGELGAESLDAVWQLMGTDYMAFLPYFQRCLPSQKQLATLPASAEVQQLFVAASAAGFDCAAHCLLVAKGAVAEDFLALQPDSFALLDSGRKNPAVLAFLYKRALKQKEAALASQLCVLLNPVQVLSLAQGIDEVVLQDAAYARLENEPARSVLEFHACYFQSAMARRKDIAFDSFTKLLERCQKNALPIQDLLQAGALYFEPPYWGRLLPHLTDASALLICISQMSQPTTDHLLAALPHFSLSQFQEAAGYVAPPARDWSQLGVAAVARYKDKVLPWLIQVAPVASYSATADALDRALWACALPKTSLQPLLKALLDSPATSRQIATLTACLVAVSREDESFVASLLEEEDVHAKLAAKIASCTAPVVALNKGLPLFFSSAYAVIDRYCPDICLCIEDLDGRFAIQQRLHTSLLSAFVVAAPQNAAFVVIDDLTLKEYKSVQLKENLSSALVLRHLYRNMSHFMTVSFKEEEYVLQDRVCAYLAAQSQLNRVKNSDKLFNWFWSIRLNRVAAGAHLLQSRVDFDLSPEQIKQIQECFSLLMQHFANLLGSYVDMQGKWPGNSETALHTSGMSLIECAVRCQVYQLELCMTTNRALFLYAARDLLESASGHAKSKFSQIRILQALYRPTLRGILSSKDLLSWDYTEEVKAYLSAINFADEDSWASGLSVLSEAPEGFMMRLVFDGNVDLFSEAIVRLMTTFWKEFSVHMKKPCALACIDFIESVGVKALCLAKISEWIAKDETVRSPAYSFSCMPALVPELLQLSEDAKNKMGTLFWVLKGHINPPLFLERSQQILETAAKFHEDMKAMSARLKLKSMSS